MTWEERLLFLMFLDYKGALKKWEKNHNEDKNGFSKIDDRSFCPLGGFDWSESQEGDTYWSNLDTRWKKASVVRIKVPSLSYEIEHLALSNKIEVGCQIITKEDALKIADFIYECFGEEV